MYIYIYEHVSKRLQYHAPALHVRKSLQAQVPASSLQALHPGYWGLFIQSPFNTRLATGREHLLKLSGQLLACDQCVAPN